VATILASFGDHSKYGSWCRYSTLHVRKQSCQLL